MTGYAGSRMHGTRNEKVGICHDRVGIIFFSGGWESERGSSRRLQVPYVTTMLYSPGSLPKVEGPDGLHDEEVGWERVLRQVVVRQVQNLD